MPNDNQTIQKNGATEKQGPLTYHPGRFSEQISVQSLLIVPNSWIDQKLSTEIPTVQRSGPGIIGVRGFHRGQVIGINLKNQETRYRPDKKL